MSGFLRETRHTPAARLTPALALDPASTELYENGKYNLASENPQKLRELQRLFLIEAVKYNVLPLDDRRIERMNPDLRARLSIVQQARAEDLDDVRDTYVRLGVGSEIAPFFSDLPARMAAAHLVISRSGASTVAELSAIGRPAILVPLPHALDQDQLANAGVLEAAGGAICIAQADFTAERLNAEIAGLSNNPARLAQMAQAAKSAGTVDAAERLADLVLSVAGI
jgi:UDP-N-acetylglucosamine:LPS N-acetylglucosamine transferase